MATHRMDVRHERSARPVIAWLMVVLSVLLIGVLSNTSSATAEEMSVTVAPTKVVDYEVLSPRESATVALPGVPANATSATFEVWGRYAWRSTKISVCAGATAPSSCTSNPVLVTPVQSAETAQTKVDLTGLGGATPAVTVYNQLASARVTVTLLGYTLPAAPAPTPTSSSEAAPTTVPATTPPTTTPPPTTAPPTTAPSTSPPTTAPSTSPPATTPPLTTAPPTTTPATTPPPTTPSSPAPSTSPTVPSAGPSTDKAHWQPPMVTGLDPKWPGPSNTGVPAGTKLTVWDGPLTITEANTHIDGLEIRGLVTIKAPNVLITNSRILGPATPPPADRGLIQVADAGVSVTVQDSEVFAQYPSYRLRGVIGKNFTLIRVNIHHVIDQMIITGDNVLVQDSWLHDNTYYLQDPNYNNKPSHDDNAQISIGKNLRFLHNTMQGTHNAAIQITQDRGPVTDIVVQGNFIDNGACSINIAEKSYGPIKGMTIQDNVFGNNTWVKNCGILSPPMTTPLLSLGNNTWLSGGPVAVSRGA